MGIKKLNPVTAGTRHKVALTFDEFTTDKPQTFAVP
jgi:large subunit ribosomal protein L2